MLKSPENKAVNRIIDANINRAKEGLRVCEEVARFRLNDRRLSAGLKEIRHALSAISARLPLSRRQLLKARDSRADIGRDIYADELKRSGIRDIFFANIQRAKESIRVLEEFSKLSGKGLALKFKALRYRLYEIESKISRL